MKEIKLIDNWLLEENASFCKYDGTFDKRSLFAILNVFVCNLTCRNKYLFAATTKEKWAETATVTASILSDIDPDLSGHYLYIVTELQDDDEFYVTYINYLYNNCFKILNNGGEISALLADTEDIKTWKKANGIFVVELIDNWLHPLSEIISVNLDGKQKPCGNLWYAASHVCAVACSRYPGDQQAAITTLVKAGVVKMNRIQNDLRAMKTIDSIYAAFISNTKLAFEADAGNFLDL